MFLHHFNRFNFYLSLFSLILASLSISPCFAEITCASTVSYNWEKKGETGQKGVIFSVVFAHGSTEEAARAELILKSRLSQADALISCQQEHETISSCVSQKFNRAQGAFKNGSFSTRRAIETAITEECSKDLGTCLSTDTSQPECHALSIPTPTPVASPETSAPAETKKGNK
jgi:hypothetical protein